ncbi:unnamed protein product [Timema podura]|uniref:Uncharacterized protein n=1 Tax=Timema podura TaxID=61482 RepID=A0ABN7NU61_TIMPD|nr:unnamed protein product [Timema podura]
MREVADILGGNSMPMKGDKDSHLSPVYIRCFLPNSFSFSLCAMELRQRPSIATSSMAEPHLSMETLVTQGLYNPFDEDSGHLNNGGGQILNTDSCQNIISDLPSRNMVHILGDESNRKHVTMRRPQEYRSLPQETQADKIVSEMEKDTELMEDNPVSEQLRMYEYLFGLFERDCNDIIFTP